MEEAENNAYLMIIYAHAGLRSGGQDLVKRSGAVQVVAPKIAAAAKGKDFNGTKKEVEELAKILEKNWKPADGAANPPLNLRTAVPIKNLMKEVSNLNRQIQSPVPKDMSIKRWRATEWQMKGKAEYATTASYKMTLLMLAAAQHHPEKDPAAGANKDEAKMTIKAWVDSSLEVKDHTLGMAEAAKGKNQSKFNGAVTKMDTACTKCHDIFRVETP
jgi:hypothetical protein